ncbi:ROK family transcriptional regulator [Paenibacillus hunanensis]|uniref:ROK family transcriptional regulator n=1 Tax=Paenibacillus hunanensis TaxID=539262 RepID=UPI002A6B5B48|nr:ROK family transcriptional regulator [Paenibacillus hunanensis]WPP40788.1 ROK family transcriptional regulator [Paenibacillus hunanensis]
MKITGDQALVKKINKSLVLDNIRLYAPLSRTRVSQLTGLNKATVSNLVQELIDDRLVLESGEGQSSGGRKPLMLEFNPNAGYAAGVELSVNELTIVLTDLEGKIITRHTEPLPDHRVETTLELMQRMMAVLVAEVPPSVHGLIGMGVGVPGMVDEQGNVLFAPNLGWEGVPLREELEQLFGLPVTIDNEANAGAIGELQFGAGRHARHLVYISVGMGIGSGIIIDGQPYKGARGYAGETGHMSVEANGLPCSCGSRGCWELYASELAYEHTLIDPHPNTNTAYWVQQAMWDEPEAIRLFQCIGEYLGVGITNLVNSFNPELVIIGGHMRQAEPWIAPHVEAVVSQRTLPYHRQKLVIQYSELGEQSTVIGAAYAAISQFLGRVRVSI